jgi:hypothetical protein
MADTVSRDARREDRIGQLCYKVTYAEVLYREEILLALNEFGPLKSVTPFVSTALAS